MQRSAFVLAVLALLHTGCGDNSEQCGPGTISIDNICIPSGACGPGTTYDAMAGLCTPDGSVVCTDGTKFDTALGICVIDPSSCQDGTVLINGACADPTGGLVIDVEEGPEPNGDNIIESSTAPAGLVPALKDVGGSGIVLHGFIAPFRDIDGDGLLDPDVDTYVVTVAGPTLVKVTADGVHGVLGAFAVFADVAQADPLAQYLRVGLSLTGDTSKRQLFLPRAGQYQFVIGDSRTFYQYTTGGPLDAAPGGGEYYVTIDQLSPVTPTSLTKTGNVATVSALFASDETKFYSVAMGSGENLITLDMPYVQSRGGVVAMRDSTVLGASDEGTAGQPAQLMVNGFAADQPGVIVADPEYNTASEPVPFMLSVQTNYIVCRTDTDATGRPEVQRR
jgi:hypothetical protein